MGSHFEVQSLKMKYKLIISRQWRCCKKGNILCQVSSHDSFKNCRLFYGWAFYENIYTEYRTWPHTFRACHMNVYYMHAWNYIIDIHHFIWFFICLRTECWDCAIWVIWRPKFGECNKLYRIRKYYKQDSNQVDSRVICASLVSSMFYLRCQHK